MAFMSKTFRAPMLQLLFAEGEIPRHVQVIRAGVYHDPRYGEFHVTKEMLLSMVKNFNANILKIDLAIDYSHKSDEEAAGWIKKLSLEQDGTELWADVDWTPTGKKTLSDKRYRYLSADFTDNYVDNQTLEEFGPTLRGAGLTNRPVVKGMAPVIELSEKKEGQMPTNEELQAQIKTLTESVTALTKKLSDAPAPPAKKEEGKDGDDDGDMKAKLADLQKKCDELMAENAKYSEKFGKLDADKKASEQKQAFDKMLADGKAVEAQRESFMKGDMVAFAEKAQPVNLGGKGHGGEGERKVATAGEAIEEVRKRANKMLSEKGAKDLGDAYSKVLKEDPELRAKYEQANK
jgi:phage I-like protein